MFTLEKLLKFLEKEGYKNAKPDAASVKAFLTEKNIVINNGENPVDIDAMFAAKSARKVNLSDDLDDKGDDDTNGNAADDKVVIEAANRLIKAMHGAARGSNPPASVGGTGGLAGLEAKSYNAEAARGRTRLPDADTAAVVGAWARLAMTADGKHRQYPSIKSDREILAKANVAYDFSSGGFAVPEFLSGSIINLRSRIGALNAVLPAMPIAAGGQTVPRRTSGVTIYSTTEAPTTAITDSNSAGDQVKLSTFNMSGLVYASNKWLAASAISAGDLITGELAYALNSKMENIFVNGDGTSTHFNQLGLKGKFEALVIAAGGTWTTNAEYAAGGVRAAGATWASVTEANLLDLMGQVGDLEGMDMAGNGLAFLCSYPFYCAVFLRLMLAKGGVTMVETANGLRVPSYMGHPIYFTPHMPQQSAASSACCYFGSYGLGAKHGIVPELSVLESNNSVGWTMNKMAFKISEEHALTVHDVGNANSTASSRTTGPVSFLITTS